MLIEFSVENFKSFADKSVFSMIKAQKQKGLDYSLFHTKVNRKALNILCSSVIYGPNASGKTTLIGAMDVLRSVIINGHIRNKQGMLSPANPALDELRLIPNKDNRDGKDTNFSIEVLLCGMRIKYTLKIWLGKFYEESDDRHISEEILFINDKMVFTRGENIDIGDLSVIKKYLDKSHKTSEEISGILKRSLNKTELFLTNGFKLVFAPEFVQLFVDWMENKFKVIYHSNEMYLNYNFNNKKNFFYSEKSINEAARMFGVKSNAVGYIKKDDDDSELVSIVERGDGKKIALPVSYFESLGTERFFNIFPLVLDALERGVTLIVDEFDASLHPMAVMSIVNMFHNDEINKNHAQLIFNTHNPIFLNSNVFRRDEIKFVERDDDTNKSEIYSLSDFKTTGKEGVRKTEDYMKNYFVGRYGAIKDIDFSSLFDGNHGKTEVK